MALKLECGYLKGFIGEHEYAAMASQVESAHALLASGKGPGNDFLGWVDLPTNYDKEEFARIKAAAERIKKNTDVFIVIGIGGSYLGARAAIEFLKSEHYNALKKDTPDIYFTGNSISSTALAELVEICEGKDISINMISKSGTTTEPAIAFRVFREILEKKYGKEEAKKRIFCTTDKARGTLRTKKATRPSLYRMMSAAVTPFSPLWVCCPSLWPVRISTHSWRAHRRHRLPTTTRTWKKTIATSMLPFATFFTIRARRPK